MKYFTFCFSLFLAITTSSFVHGQTFSVGSSGTSPNGSYTLDWNGIPVTRIEESVNGVLLKTYDVSTGNQSMVISDRINGNYTYQFIEYVEETCMEVEGQFFCLGPWTIPYGQATVAVTNAPPPSYSPTEYVTKVLDLNGDGKDDIYVTGGSTRTVGDFALIQNNSHSFDIDPSPSNEDATRAFYTPESGITVIREEYSGDGLYDFQFAYVDEFIADAYDFFVTTTFGNGTASSKVIPQDSTFFSTRAFVELILEDPQHYKALYNNQVQACVNNMIEWFYWDPNYFFDPDAGGYGTYYGGWTTIWIPVQTCMSSNEYLANIMPPKIYQFTGSIAQLPDSIINSFQGIPDGAAYEAYQQAMNNIFGNSNWWSRVTKGVRKVQKAAKILRRASTVATVVILADDVTVIGAADDVALVATFTGLALGWIVDEALDLALYKLETAVNEDVGYDVDEKIESGLNIFAIPETCTPTPGGGNAGSSKVLRDRLDEDGCLCEEAIEQGVKNSVHHIVKKGGKSAIEVCLRKCTISRGIDLDSSMNGVCLPGEQTSDSPAFKHAGREGELHKTPSPALLSKCLDPNQDFGSFLRHTAQQYTLGEFPIGTTGPFDMNAMLQECAQRGFL